MASEIVNALQKIIDKTLLNSAYVQLSSYIEDNISHIDLTYTSNTIENVEHATLIDFELIKIDQVSQFEDSISFNVVVNAEIEIEETIQRDRVVDSVQKWFVLSCIADIDGIGKSFSVKSISVY